MDERPRMWNVYAVLNFPSEDGPNTLPFLGVPAVDSLAASELVVKTLQRMHADGIEFEVETIEVRPEPVSPIRRADG